MILKAKDDIGPLVSQLDGLLKRPLTDRQRRAIEQEKATMLAGAKAEAEAAYLIDFHLKDSEHWAVLHDLRLEHNGRVAQIDHLLICSVLDIYVVESKGFRTKIRITGDQWEVLRNSHWTGITSPVAQNERHILVLKELIQASTWAPKFFGSIKQPIRYVNVVAVPPECSLRGESPEVMVVSMDNLVKTVRHDHSGLFSRSLFSGISRDGLCDLGLDLLDCHRPVKFDFAAKFGVGAQATEAVAVERPNGHLASKCVNCGTALTQAEAFFCRVNKPRFAGQFLCRKCQSFVPKVKREAAPAFKEIGSRLAPSPAAVRADSRQCCADCGEEVESKVVAFCRLKSRRFGGKVVCRSCQTRYHC